MDKVTSEVVRTALNAKDGPFAKKPALGELLSEFKLAIDGTRLVMVSRVIDFFDRSRGRPRTVFLKRLGRGLAAAVKAAASDSDKGRGEREAGGPQGQQGRQGQEGRTARERGRDLRGVDVG